jgi:hypothetical protein
LIRIAGVLWLAALALGVAAPAAGAYVYWGNDETATIGRAASDGTQVEPSFIKGAGVPNALAVDSGHIYWANYTPDSIGRASISGANVEPEFIKLPYAPTGIAVNESHIYWTGSTFIGRASLNGTGVEPEFIKNVGFSCGLTVDSGHLYWALGSSGTGYVARAALNGSKVEPEYVEMSPVEVLCGVAVNTSNVFWADSGLGFGNNIGRANLSTGKGVDISFIGAALGPCELAVFGSKLYWPNTGTSTIARANTDSTGVEYEWIHTGAAPRTICGIAVDGLAPPPPPPPPPPGGGGGSDTTPPQTKITKGPGKKLAQGKAKFSFTSSEPGSTFTCKLDKKKAARCRSPKTYSGLKPGRQTLSVWATDAAGNKDPTPAKRSFRVP